MTIETPNSAPGAVRTASILVLAGTPALLALPLVMPAVNGVPVPVLLLQPALLLVIAASVGSRIAPKSGLHLAMASPMIERAWQLGLGTGLGLVIAAADYGLRSLWQPAPGLPPSIVEAWSPVGLLIGVLYGGVVEEVMFRWFAMSLFAVGLSRLVAGQASSTSRGWIMPTAAFGAAVLFAASHLPALAMAGAPVAIGAVVRTLVLNGIAGVVFGWLFARRDLVAAMLAHGGCHLGFAAAALVAET